MARPSKFNPKVAAKILEALRAGNTVEASARYAGISPSTFYEWMRKGRAPNADAGLAQFVADVEQALAAAEVRFVTGIAKAAADGEWRAGAWWLTRRSRDDWGDRPPELPAGQIEVTVVWPEDEGIVAEGPYPKDESNENFEAETGVEGE